MGALRGVIFALLIAASGASCAAFTSGGEPRAGDAVEAGAGSEGGARDAGSDPASDGGGDGADDSGLDSPDVACDGGRDCERIVFMTSIVYPGNLGGLTGADDECNIRAKSSTVLRVRERSYVAWLSGPAAVGGRMVHGAAPYVLPRGEAVAVEWTTFASATHARAIDEDESGNPVAGPVWTDSAVAGGELSLGAENCASWTSTEATSFGITGDSASTDKGWSEGPPQACATPAGLYCVEH